jgi:hypothetical protein
LLTTKRGERQIGERERETNREKIIKKKKKRQREIRDIWYNIFAEGFPWPDPNYTRT